MLKSQNVYFWFSPILFNINLFLNQCSLFMHVRYRKHMTRYFPHVSYPSSLPSCLITSKSQTSPALLELSISNHTPSPLPLPVYTLSQIIKKNKTMIIGSMLNFGKVIKSNALHHCAYLWINSLKFYTACFLLYDKLRTITICWS